MEWGYDGELCINSAETMRLASTTRISFGTYSKQFSKCIHRILLRVTIMRAVSRKDALELWPRRHRRNVLETVSHTKTEPCARLASKSTTRLRHWHLKPMAMLFWVAPFSNTWVWALTIGLRRSSLITTQQEIVKKRTLLRKSMLLKIYDQLPCSPSCFATTCELSVHPCRHLIE